MEVKTMGDKNVYIIAKVFDRQGCIAYKCKEPQEVRCVPGTLERIRNKGVQIVLLDDPEIYAEYAPYRYIDSLKDFVLKVVDLNKA